MAEVMNQLALEKELSFWKNILNLKDWKIQIKICRARDMREGCQGSIVWDAHNKDAIIRVLDPIDYPEDAMTPQNMRNTVVHELLHLHFAPISDNFSQGDKQDIYNLFEEQAICAIAASLLELDDMKGAD